MVVSFRAENMTGNATKPSKNATFYFGHSTGILNYLSLLGINRDALVFTSSNYDSVTDRYGNEIGMLKKAKSNIETTGGTAYHK